MTSPLAIAWVETHYMCKVIYASDIYLALFISYIVFIYMLFTMFRLYVDTGQTLYI